MRQLTIQDIYPVRTPCNRQCDVEWCSRTCFERRGHMWNYNGHGWLRDNEGNLLIGKSECDWMPKDEEEALDEQSKE